MAPQPQISKPRVVIAGGGIAGIEALLALRDLAPDRAELTLVAAEREFVYKPLIVEEPFGAGPAERHELGPAVSEIGGRFVLGVVKGVRPGDHRIAVMEGSEGRQISELEYDLLLACMGGRSRTAYKHAVTFRFRAIDDPLQVDELLQRAGEHDSRTIAFVAPPGVTWTLPLYELALLTRRRAEQGGIDDIRISLITPEEEPLILFGREASDALAELLQARGIEFRGAVTAREDADGTMVLTPGEERLEAGAVAALPVIEGPRVPGLPADEHGFIPIDEHARVRGVDDVYAAGDGTNFPIKQGGIGTQQADAAAEHIAALLGATIDPQPFHPVLRGQLITGDESLSMRHDLTGGHGEGQASPDYLWWPPHKVSGRYLSPWLAGTSPHADPEPPPHSIDVEVALPKEWHSEPMTMDPLQPPEDG